MVSDLGGANRGLHSELNISELKPYFVNPANNENIFVLADVPHLLKLIRNNFVDHGFLIDNKVIKKEIVEQAINTTLVSDLKITHKITLDQLNVAGPQRQRVKYAAKLFPHTMSSAISRCGTLGFSSVENGAECAEFFKLVNDRFDVFNVSIPVSDSRARNRAYGLALEDQNLILNKMSEVISYLKVIGSRSKLPFQKALLSGTLRTYQRAGCDNDIVTLKCPAGTSIAVQIAQYGKSASSKGLCSKFSSTTASLQPEIFDSTICLLPNTIQTVVEACQKKRQCKFQTSPTTFGGDPCPGLPKYVEVAYKCRPYEFRSKVACENERILLKCNPNSRVAVYSASYGRTQYESMQCPQPQGVPEETCLASYATETVMQLCHGKRNCDLAADIGTFGSPCKPQSRMYLKVVYACVPRRVLKDQYEGPLEPDETDYDPNEAFEEFDNYDTENEHIRESAASPPVSKLDNVSKDNFTKDAEGGLVPKDKNHALGFEIHQRYIIYIGISVTVVLFLLITFLVGRILLKKHRTEKESTFYATSISDHTLANGFTDDISEVDADIDLQTTLPMPIPSVTVHPAPMGTIAEVVRYPEYPDYPHMHSHTHTFRGSQSGILESEIVPTRPMRDASTSQYYYG